ncbi:MAG: Flp family type IVb pilin [Alphaproteobacteria bacterium]
MATAIEYGLMSALVGVVIIAGVTAISTPETPPQAQQARAPQPFTPSYRRDPRTGVCAMTWYGYGSYTTGGPVACTPEILALVPAHERPAKLAE